MKAKPFNRIASAFSRQDWVALSVELVIVILGITIAFQLNSWKEERNRRELLDYYRANLLAEIQDNLAEFDGLKGYRAQTVQSLDTLLILLRTKSEKYDEPIRNHLKCLLRTSIPNITTASFPTLHPFHLFIPSPSSFPTPSTFSQSPFNLFFPLLPQICVGLFKVVVTEEAAVGSEGGGVGRLEHQVSTLIDNSSFFLGVGSP